VKTLNLSVPHFKPSPVTANQQNLILIYLVKIVSNTANIFHKGFSSCAPRK